MVKTKVFVGNLSFKTLESALQKEFEVAGKVYVASFPSSSSPRDGILFHVLWNTVLHCHLAAPLVRLAPLISLYYPYHTPPTYHYRSAIPSLLPS